MMIDLSGATVPELIAALSEKCDVLVLAAVAKPEHVTEGCAGGVEAVKCERGKATALAGICGILHHRAMKAVCASLDGGTG